MRQRQKRRKLACAALFCAAISAGFKTQRGVYTSSIHLILAVFILSYVYFPCVVFSIFALSMERTRLSFHCWLYSLCIVVYVTNKTWNLSILSFPAWLAVRNNTSLFLQRLSLCFIYKRLDIFTFYVAWKREKARLNPIWPVRLKRICRNAIWVGFQTTYRNGFAHKSYLGWQSERGYSANINVCHNVIIKN